MKKLCDEIEKLLIGNEGIVMGIRYGEGIDPKNASIFFDQLEILIDNYKLNDNIPKVFFLLMLDCITSISSCVEINEDKEAITIFLDELTEKLRSI